MRGLRIPANAALQRALPVFGLVALAGLGFWTVAITFEPGWKTGTAAFTLPAIVGFGLWLIAKGHTWARWLLTAAFGALGLWGVKSGLGQTLLSPSPVDWATIVVALLFIAAASGLFASDALDELTASPRLRSGLIGWDVVSAPDFQCVATKISALPEQPELLRRRFWGRVAGWISTSSAAMAWAVFLPTSVWLWSVAPGIRTTSDGLLGLVSILMYALVAGVIFAYLVGAYLLLFVAPFLVAVPIALPVALWWKQPARFLILRPFNRAHISRTLRQLLCRELAPLGHGYTLADAHIRVPLWLRLPLLLGQLSFFAYRQRRIAAPSHIPRLIRAMQRRVLRNFNWCVSQDKIFPVACVDAGWRACVTRLVAECDCIVMDLSGISGNILWELELLKRTQALERTVFLVDAQQHAAAQAALDGFFDGADGTRRLLRYETRDLLEADSLTAAATNALNAAIRQRTTNPRS